MENDTLLYTPVLETIKLTQYVYEKTFINISLLNSDFLWQNIESIITRLY